MTLVQSCFVFRFAFQYHTTQVWDYKEKNKLGTVKIQI